MSIKDRLIQYILRGKDELSPEARKAADALKKVKDEGEALREELDKTKGAQGLVNVFRSTGEGAERARVAWERAEKKAAELREELNKTPDSKGLAVSLRQTEQEAARAGRQLDKLTAETKKAEEAARAAGVDTAKLADEEQRLAAELVKAQRAVSDNAAKTKELEREQRAAARAAAEHKNRIDSARGAMDSAGKRVLAFAAAYISLASAMRLVRGGINLVRDGIGAVIGAGRDSEDALVQLNAALHATGNAAGWSAEQLLKMAEDLRDVSNFTTEQIVSGQTRLLSYTDVVGEQFPAAMQIVIDQSQRLGISIEQSAETVGRALQSPSKAMEALGRQGFKLEAGQQALLKRLEATGKMAEAQAIIMDMLNESYGGAAAAARMGTITGLWQGLRNQVGDFFSMVSSSGAFDYVKGKLEEWSVTISRMKDDGRLQALAEALSNAFVQGAQKVEEFIKSLAKVDFKTLTDDATAWLNGFGGKIDDATMRLKLFFAPFRTLFNGFTAGISGIGVAFTGTIGLMLRGVEEVASKIPDLLGGEKIHASVKRAREAMNAIRDGFVAQIEQDGRDTRDAWDTTSKHAVDSQKVVADAAAQASGEARDQWDDMVDDVVAKQQELAQQLLQTYLTGTNQIQSMAEALELIDTASTVEQFEGLRKVLMRAYQDGRITQEEFANSLNLITAGINDLGGEAEETARRIDDIVNAMGDFADVQKVIKNAQTDVDISKIRSAITRMYEEGELSAKEYNQALKELDAQQKKLKESTDKQAGSQSGLAGELQKVTAALQEQAAAAQAAAKQQQEQQAVNRAAFSAYFDEVMSAARSPLAELSDKALEAFDALKGISSTDISLDTSSLEATSASLAQVNGLMGELQISLNNRMRGPFARWADETMLASKQVQREYLNQKLQLQKLMEAYDKGSITLDAFQGRAKGLRNSLDLLDEADLTQLDGAISNAKQRMDSLADSTRNTLDSLRDELDRLRGNEEAIERRRMTSRQRELQAQLAEAQASGDAMAIANLREALGMLQSIQSETALAREQAAREQRRQPTQAEGPAGAQAPGGTSQAPARIIRLESARGSRVDVSVQEGQEDALLGILEQSGLRTI